MYQKNGGGEKKTKIGWGWIETFIVVRDVIIPLIQSSNINFACFRVDFQLLCLESLRRTQRKEKGNLA